MLCTRRRNTWKRLLSTLSSLKALRTHHLKLLTTLFAFVLTKSYQSCLVRPWGVSFKMTSMFKFRPLETSCYFWTNARASKTMQRGSCRSRVKLKEFRLITLWWGLFSSVLLRTKQVTMCLNFLSNSARISNWIKPMRRWNKQIAQKC